MHLFLLWFACLGPFIKVQCMPVENVFAKGHVSLKKEKVGKQLFVRISNQRSSIMSGAGGGKTDMERLGLFSEVGYTTLGDKYPKVHLTSCEYFFFKVFEQFFACLVCILAMFLCCVLLKALHCNWLCGCLCFSSFGYVSN